MSIDRKIFNVEKNITSVGGYRGGRNEKCTQRKC